MRYPYCLVATPFNKRFPCLFMAVSETVLAALGGAAASQAVSVVWAWLRAPAFDLDFENFGTKKPYVHQLLDTSNSAQPVLTRFFRLKVSNAGNEAAHNCEAKLEVWKDGVLDPAIVLLHWARRDPAIYTSLETAYASVTINRDGREAVDVLTHVQGSLVIQSYSPRAFSFNAHQNYDLRVTVSGSNVGPKTFAFSLNWDGTWDGFDTSLRSQGRLEAVTKRIETFRRRDSAKQGRKPT
jgi:hypothetical protein